MNYSEAIDWLFSTQMLGIKLGLDGPRFLLREFLAIPPLAPPHGSGGKPTTELIPLYVMVVTSAAHATTSKPERL